MIGKHSVLGAAILTMIVAASCAKGASVDAAGNKGGGSGDGGTLADGAVACPTCDSDGDGVPDGTDKCPGTAAGAKVNKEGCADTQVTPQLEPTFPPYSLVWTPTGSLGRAGGLTWTYTGIQRGDLFDIYWVVCDDPATPCGISLNGPIDVPSENWALSATDSDLPGGKLVFTNTTSIVLDDASVPALTGRLTVTIVDDSNAVIPFADVSTFGMTPRAGKYGAEIKGTGFKVVALAEVKDATSTWTPYADYYDAAGTAPTGDAGGNAFTSFGGSFYDK